MCVFTAREAEAILSVGVPVKEGDAASREDSPTPLGPRESCALPLDFLEDFFFCVDFGPDFPPAALNDSARVEDAMEAAVEDAEGERGRVLPPPSPATGDVPRRSSVFFALSLSVSERSNGLPKDESVFFSSLGEVVEGAVEDAESTNVSPTPADPSRSGTFPFCLGEMRFVVGSDVGSGSLGG